VTAVSLRRAFGLSEYLLVFDIFGHGLMEDTVLALKWRLRFKTEIFPLTCDLVEDPLAEDAPVLVGIQRESDSGGSFGVGAFIPTKIRSPSFRILSQSFGSRVSFESDGIGPIDPSQSFNML